MDKHTGDVRAANAGRRGGLWNRLLERLGLRHEGCGGTIVRVERQFGPGYLCARCGYFEYSDPASGEG
ncbi:MAG: hypothetical protein J0H10_15950 [Alphaproteobacteria bacterium]|nr:hypothetical protein [Alphaproteobacteria bacterium]